MDKDFVKLVDMLINVKHTALRAESASAARDTAIKRLGELREEFNEVSRKLMVANKIIQAHAQSSGNIFAECSECGGQGGGEIDMGKDGCDYWECATCAGTGVVRIYPENIGKNNA